MDTLLLVELWSAHHLAGHRLWGLESQENCRRTNVLGQPHALVHFGFIIIIGSGQDPTWVQDVGGNTIFPEFLG